MKRVRAISYPAVIALGFFILIMFGTALLALPAASRSGESVGFVDALFTSTSASCVTGLIIADTYAQWTLFGQTVILVLIQIGGLGFMTIFMTLSSVLNKRIGLTARSLMQESINTMYLGGIVRLAKKIFKGTILFEGLGALVLAIRFSADMDFGTAVYYGIWHSISAFCNAGFDLMGRFDEGSSLVNYVGDATVNITIMSLIIIGGIGFFVWEDISRNKLRFKHYSLHTKIVLSVTAFLIILPAVAFFFSERSFAYKGLSLGDRTLAALFNSVTARTAGFNTVDTAALSPFGRLATVVLMFIGGSPGSTAGGIKTTTVAIILFSVIANIRGRSCAGVYGRRFEKNAFVRASAVVAVNLTLVLSASAVIMALQPMLASQDVLFEAFSAVGTVGMTVGITSEFSTASRLIVALLMYCGRVGSLSFAMIFTENKVLPPVVYPVEKVRIG